MFEMDNILEADYLEYKVNETIPIYSGEFIISVNDTEVHSFTGEVSLNWLPSPILKFIGDSVHNRDWIFNNLFDSVEKNKLKIIIPNYIEGDVFISGFSSNTIGNINIKGEITNILEYQPEKVTYVKCAIVNFENTYGQFVKYNSVAVRNRIKINMDDWEIVIDKRPDYTEKKINENLKNSGGYAITHLCRIKRHDGQAFETKDISILEEALYWTLSFASGRHVGIVFLEGFHNNELTWRKYQTPLIDRWKYRKTWFPNKEGEPLSIILPQIYIKLQDEFWGNVLTNILSWYLECQSDGIIENKIVSNQVALETLAWTYLVEDQGILKEEQYKDMRASDIYRLFFKQFGLDSSIPKQFPYLEDAKKLKYEDSAYLLTDYRNNIVHPRKKKKFGTLKSDFSFYVLRLGLQYLELSLLFILKYDGKYINQLYFGWNGTYDLVPWKANPSQ